MAEIQFVRNKKYGTVGTGKNGWAKEVCNVSWNQKGPKLDLREWSPDYVKMSRGITLTKQEAKRLLAILATIDFEEFDAVAVRQTSGTQSNKQMYQNQQPVQPAKQMILVDETNEEHEELQGGSFDGFEVEDTMSELLPTSV